MSVLTVPVDEGRLVHRHPGSPDSCGLRWRTVTAKALHSIEGKLIMLLAHAVTLAEARSYLAALADEAATFDSAVEYEHALLYLDLIHGDDIPALDASGFTDDRAILHAIAVSAVKELTDHGVDKLQVELLLDMLDVARDRDDPCADISEF